MTQATDKVWKTEAEKCLAEAAEHLKIAQKLVRTGAITLGLTMLVCGLAVGFNIGLVFDATLERLGVEDGE